VNCNTCKYLFITAILKRIEIYHHKKVNTSVNSDTLDVLLSDKPIFTFVRFYYKQLKYSRTDVNAVVGVTPDGDTKQNVFAIIGTRPNECC